MNDPLGLFEEDNNNDPLGLFSEQEAERSLGEKSIGLLETGASMLAGAPSQIAGGLAGVGSLMIGEGIDKASQRMQAVQESNFGFGQYKPSTAAGQEYTEDLGEFLQGIQEGGGNIGAKLGGMVGRENAGRYVGELLTGTAMEFPELLLGGAALSLQRPRPAKVSSSKVNDILEQNRGLEIDVRTPDGSLNETVQFPPTNETTQLELFDQPLQGRMVSPYEATTGDWRIDENGMPVRIDLSLEAQNMQNPLQRNLWGDELDVQFPRDPAAPLGPRSTGDIEGFERFSEPVNFRNDPENQRPLTEAIDSMDPAARTAALQQTQMGREMQASPELEVAKMQAEGFRFPMSQRGVVDPSVFLGDFPDFVASKIKDAAGQLKVLFRGVKEDYTTPDRPMLGTLGEGIYLTESTTMANNYARGGTEGRQVRAYYANVKNPYVMEIGSPEHSDLLLSSREDRKAFSDRVKTEGYDGVVLKAGDQLKEVMVFSPQQAKNAFTVPSKQVRVPKAQRGVIKIDWSDLLKMDNAPLDGKLIPPTPDVAAAIEAAKKQGKDGKQWNYLQSGATSVAMKTGSPIIRAAEDIVQNAIKRADLSIRNFVFPAEKALRSLPKQELVDLGELMKAEMFEGKAINPDVLTANLSEKQLRAYTQMRELFDQTLAAQNAAREAKGQKPINAREAYMASRWQGDFRQPVYDAEGNLVWYLAAHTKLGLQAQAKALQKIKPGLVIDPAKAHTVKSLKNGTDLQSAYSTMLDILDPNRDKEAIQALKTAVEDQMLEESEMTLAQSRHFKQKTGVRGFAGDRPWMDKQKDMTEMFQQQIQYAKNAFKWSEMQGVADSVKSIISDEDLQKTQPNNVKYIREYVKNALGYSETQLVRALDDSMRNTGVSPQMVSNAVGNVKSFFITQKLAISAGYTLSNLIQAGNVLPYLADMSGRGIIGNPMTTLPVGFLGGMAMGVSHYIKALGSSYLDQLPNQFFKDAFQYAEQNGVTARSVYDEAPIESGMGIGSRIGRGMSKSMTIPETFVRSVAFMTYAEWLRSSGKFPDQQKLFQEAERLVNKSMVDYRETERPLIFSKLGTTGNFLNTLQTYPISFYNQWSYMLGQTAKGNPAGLAALAAFQFAIAGAMGMPFFDDMEKMYKWIRDNMVGDSTWTKMMSSPFFSDPKTWMIDNLGEGAVYGLLSDYTGIGLTSRVAAPGAGAMLQSPVGPITDIAGQIGAVGKAVMDPTNSTKVAQAAMKVAPVGLQGALETAPFMKDVTYVTRPDGTRVYQRASDLADRRGGYARTPEEDSIRQLGIRSQKEVLTRDVEYAARSNNQAITQRGGEIVDKYYDAIRRKDYKKAMDLNKLYVQLTGKGISDTQLNNQLMDEFLTGMEKTNKRSTTPLQIQNAVRANKILKENQ